MDLVTIARRLSKQAGKLAFGPPVTHVYNPLDYAWDVHREYLERFGDPPKEVLLVGMNPGPFGMVQTGVPFGEVTAARDWLELDGAGISKPAAEHPKRPILGFDTRRREVSGVRFWGWVRQRFATPERFFERFFVGNYCPLAFLEDSGRNRTPDKLPVAERRPLFGVCDAALRRTVEVLRPRYVVAIGAFTEGRIRAVIDSNEVTVGRILHPSPANPAANQGWAEAAEGTLQELGVRLREQGPG